MDTLNIGFCSAIPSSRTEEATVCRNGTLVLVPSFVSSFLSLLLRHTRTPIITTHTAQVRGPRGDEPAGREGVQAGGGQEPGDERVHPPAEGPPPPAEELPATAGGGQRQAEEAGALVPGKQRHSRQGPHEATGDVYTVTGKSQALQKSSHGWDQVSV